MLNSAVVIIQYRKMINSAHVGQLQTIMGADAVRLDEYILGVHTKNWSSSAAQKTTDRDKTSPKRSGVSSDEVLQSPCVSVIPPFLTEIKSRGYATNTPFCFGVIPPMPILGLS